MEKITYRGAHKLYGNQGCSASVETRLRAGRPWFNSRQWAMIGFLFATASRPALGHTQCPIQWIPGTPTPEVKQPGREADHSPPSSAEVTNAWSYISTPQISFHDVVSS